ncbi:hypothetical protein ACOJBO_07825 [Rhizobium beringeri]
MAAAPRHRHAHPTEDVRRTFCGEWAAVGFDPLVHQYPRHDPRCVPAHGPNIGPAQRRAR